LHPTAIIHSVKGLLNIQVKTFLFNVSFFSPDKFAVKVLLNSMMLKQFGQEEGSLYALKACNLLHLTTIPPYS